VPDSSIARDRLDMLHYLVGTTSRPPKWMKPQLTRLVDEAPAGGHACGSRHT